MSLGAWAGVDGRSLLASTSSIDGRLSSITGAEFDGGCCSSVVELLSKGGKSMSLSLNSLELACKSPFSDGSEVVYGA